MICDYCKKRIVFKATVYEHSQKYLRIELGSNGRIIYLHNLCFEDGMTPEFRAKMRLGI